MANISDGNYTGLVDSTQAWLHRSDVTDSDVDNAIYLFEKDFNTQMRMRNMEAQTTIGITSGYLPNPSDWVQWKSIVRVQGQFKEVLLPLTEENAVVDYGYSYNSDPRGYVVTGDKTIIYPEPGSGAWTYQTVYYQGVPRLNSSATTNWLMTNYPHVYLQGVLFWASDFLVDNEKQLKYQQLVNKTLNDLKIASDRARLAGGVAYMRPDRFY